MTNECCEFPKFDDPLGETLHQLRLNGSLYCRSELTAPWGVDIPVLPGSLMFHIITKGRCWLQVGTQPARLLQAGDLALVPHGRGHSMFSDDGVMREDLFAIPTEKISERYEIMRYGGGGEQETELTCGVVSFDQIAGQRLLSQLPEMLVVDSLDEENDGWLQHTLRFITSEARGLKPGGETVITHLADILIIQAIRSWMASAPEAQQGWLAALRDRQIGSALVAIHREPEKDWTVEGLAKMVGMSRSGFSAKFTQLVGDSAKSYLTHWRMQVAHSKLLKQSVPIAVLAEELGYNSEAAFSRAFKRIIGVSPGSVRR